MKVQGNLDFDEFIADAMVAQIGSFCAEIEYDVIRQLFLTNSFFPTNFHMIGDNNSYMLIVTFVYTMELQREKLLKCSLDNRFRLRRHYWNYWRHFIWHLNEIRFLKHLLRSMTGEHDIAK